MFKPKKAPVTEAEPVDFDREVPIDTLQKLVQCKTVSYYESEKEDDAEFEMLIDLLPQLYPEVFKICSFERLPDRALLFRWQGKSEKSPSVMMAHYDVVPVEEENWEKPPFEGIIEGGIMWGRGTLDTKATFNGVLSAANHLISQGFVPENDIYFAFSGGKKSMARALRISLTILKSRALNLVWLLMKAALWLKTSSPG